MRRFIYLALITLATVQLLNAQRKIPFTADEYVKNLGYGFDTDIFKASPPLRNYNNLNSRLMNDLKKIGVGHLRLRSKADIFGYLTKTFDSVSMATYLDSLDVVLKDMIGSGIFPIISWIHDSAESNPTVTDGNNYVNWWKKVAERTTNYTYELSFNLFTEINDGPLRKPEIYNDWTDRAIKAIRATGGYNKDRIIILGAPGKKADSLFTIAPAIYTNTNNIVAEWHLYASGPDKDGGQKNWAGTGSVSDKANVDSVMDLAVKFTAATKVPTWIGAWMPYDNIGASQVQYEVEAFGCYFANAALKRGIPWAMNKLDNFYDTETNTFVPSESIGRYDVQINLDLPKVLNSTLCGINAQTLNESKLCSSTCLNQNCQDYSLTRKGSLYSCSCSRCTRPCTLSSLSPCLYPFDRCLSINSKDMCIIRDAAGLGDWSPCTTNFCPPQISVGSISPSEVKTLIEQANL